MMQWSTHRYLSHIVVQKKVALVGWTSDVPARFISPKYLRTDEVKVLLPLWRTGQIRFARVSNEQIAALQSERARLVERGVLPARRKQKTRSDFNKRK